MEPARTAWHLGFVNPLAVELPRADMLLVRRVGEPHRDGEAKVLRRLWPWLRTDTILAYESPSRPFRKGDLLRLAAYGALYHAAQARLDRLDDPKDLTLVLVVASLTLTLLDEIKRMDWTLVLLGDGYGRIDGGMYVTYIVITDEVAPAEQDAYLALFSHERVTDPEAAQWFEQWLAEGKRMQNIEQLEGYTEIRRKLREAMPVEERLAGLTPEERLAGLTPEERLAGLAPEELLPALPVELLRVLPEDYLEALPSEVREKIKQRLGR